MSKNNGIADKRPRMRGVDLRGVCAGICLEANPGASVGDVGGDCRVVCGGKGFTAVVGALLNESRWKVGHLAQTKKT